MTTTIAPDGTPEATDVWRRYRTDGALASECLRTRSERDETARVREQVRPMHGIDSFVHAFGDSASRWWTRGGGETRARM